MTDNLNGTDSRLATLGSVLANWRDWNLPVKLAAVTLVPVIFAIVLGAMQIADQVDRASSYRRVDRLVVVNEELRSLVTALQRERTAGAVLLAARATDIETELRQERRAVDVARDDFTRAADRVTLDEEITGARYADVRTWLRELPGVREQVSGSLIDSTTALGRYTEIVEALLRFDRALSAESIDARLVSASSALHDLAAIGEQVQFQQAMVGVGIVRGSLVGSDLEALRASLARLQDSTVDFHAVAGPRHSQAFDRIIDEQVVTGRTNLVGAIVASRPGSHIPATIQDWDAASDAAASGIASVADVLGKELRDRSAALQDEASDGAGLAAVILLVALVVAIAVMVVVGRHLLSSLSALRRSALDVAEQRLPAAVARIRDRGEDADSITFEPVPVTSMDEVGQVARAFDAVQRQALRLATEQAGLRARYSSVFVNLSRRSQGLVQRQLHLLERLERDEEDADQLATLFQLDHLATRMRRNNENLMVLSGSDVGRRNQRPASLADLLRASVSEIEQYQRVIMLPPPNAQVVGYAVGDLVRLTAELLDNATAFSAPDTNVTIASHAFEDGSVCVAVLDEGIGMNQTELDEANAKLADSASVDVSTSRRMGLFVIGRLAGRHGIEVRLNGGHDVTGVRATVTVPAELITKRAPSEPAVPVRPPASRGLVPFTPPVNGRGHGRGANGTANGVGPTVLPRRHGPTNGSDSAGRPGGEEPWPGNLFQPTDPDGGVNGHGAQEAGGSEVDPGFGTGGRAGTDADADRGLAGVTGQGVGGPAGPHGEPDGGADADGRAGPDVEADRATRSGAGDVGGPAGDRVEAHREAGAGAGDVDGRAGSAVDSDRGLGRHGAGGRGSSEAGHAGGERGAGAGEGMGREADADRGVGGAADAGDRNEVDAKWGAAAGPGGEVAAAARSRGEEGGPTDDGGSVAGTEAERMPLPRRSPGQLPVGQHGSVDITRPRAPFAATGGAPSPADGLFSSPGRSGHGETPPPAGAPRAPRPQSRRAPVGGPRPGQPHPGGAGPSWWTPRGPGTPVDPRALEETTPIFDEMVSAWFRAVTDAPKQQAPSPDESWRFNADAGFTAARAVSRAAAAEYTDTGLPRRSPRQHLVPGSVASSPAAGPPRHGQAAEDVRDRLSSYRHGVRRARHPHDDTEQTGPLDLSGVGWRFAADVGWRAANAVSTSVDFTSGGLPRRTPLNNLVPGSVSSSSADGPRRVERAAELRGRLGSFQKGLSKGRQSLAERAAAGGIPDNKQQERE